MLRYLCNIYRYYVLQWNDLNNAQVALDTEMMLLYLFSRWSDIQQSGQLYLSALDLQISSE